MPGMRSGAELRGIYGRQITNEKVVLPQIPVDEKEHVFHIYPVLVKEREAFVEHLKEHGIATNIHYPTPIMEQRGISGVPWTDAAVSGDKAYLRRGSQSPVVPGHDRGRDTMCCGGSQ